MANSSDKNKSEFASMQCDPLAKLVVFDRLEVGPAVVEPKRTVAPYRLFFDGREESTELVYSYEEKVFDPGEPETQNLASMMSAQLALNYGLFCREIFFKGLFDENDRRFLKEMAENTAREIYVKKFLEPNLFLLDEVKGIPVVRRKSFLAAKLRFQRAGGEGKGPPWRLWNTDRKRCAVLSSGGKDSLLSFGLVRETGREVHPIFVNESGRHWFTALNAYRHFRENVENTSRVWVNSDRVFAWFLRRLPFIRKDFANVRSDEYPIRLWTVAIFLFGILPLVRKRGISSILIGDEFDTTVRSNFEGIVHYNGLFDQSVFFDYDLSRYYMKKGWSISQFSILRHLSELLIEKILVERYPDLQEHQTSCHAAHKEGEKVYPCGKCEKCRRIVSMLTAIGAEPSRCGYTISQIESCLKSFNQRGVSQLDTDAEHLAFILLEKGIIKETPTVKVHAKSHPETLKLRFDPVRSPAECIPADLRKDVYAIMLQHADGAVRRVGRKWISFDPLAENEFSSYGRIRWEGGPRQSRRGQGDKNPGNHDSPSESTGRGPQTQES